MASFPYHLETCQELFLTRESMKPEDERVPLPADPLAALAELPSLEKMNDIALEVYRSRSSAVCPFCDRSFRDRGQLEKHNIMCTATRPLRRISLVDRSSASEVETSLLCSHCGRDFKLVHQLKKHHIICTASKPLRRNPSAENRYTARRNSGSDLSSLSDSRSIHSGNIVETGKAADAKSFHSTDISLAGKHVPKLQLVQVPLAIAK